MSSFARRSWLPALTLATCAFAAAPGEALVIHYFSNLTQDKEVPPSVPDVDATGFATFVYDDQGDGFGANDTLSWKIDYDEALFPGNISSAHIHIGHSAANGDIIIDIPSQTNSQPPNGLNPPPIIGSTTLTDGLLGAALVIPPLMCGGIAVGPNFLYTASTIRNNFLCEDGTTTVLDPTDPANHGKAVNIYINLHANDAPAGFIRDQLRLKIVVPEPATLALFGLGLIGLAAVGRRKRA